MTMDESFEALKQAILMVEQVHTTHDERVRDSSWWKLELNVSSLVEQEHKRTHGRLGLIHDHQMPSIFSSPTGYE